VHETFSSDYTGPLYIIISSTENKNVGNLHPVKLGKLFINNFKGITSISPIGSYRIKIAFDSLHYANICLISPWLSENNFTASIPNSLIYSLGVIHLDLCVSKDDFWEGFECRYKAVEFRCINIKRDNILIPTKLVEIKFLSPKLPENISIFKVIYAVSPGIRSPVQCMRCLRFGHTQKYCCSKERCSHCGEFNHCIDTCEIHLTTAPKCFNCNLNHIASDRSCAEWSIQKDIKRIMVVENRSFAEAAQIKRLGTVHKGHTFADVVNPLKSVVTNSFTVKEASSSSLQSSFPPLSNSQPKRKNRKNLISTNINFSQYSSFVLSQIIPPVSSNGSYFNFVDQPVSNASNSNFIDSLSDQITLALLQSPDSQTSSPYALKSLIESSLYNFLTPKSDDDETF
jgi:hypothetical protein